MKSSDKKQVLLLAGALLGLALTIAVLVGLFDLPLGQVTLVVLTAMALAYLIRGTRRVARNVAATGRTTRAVQKLLERNRSVSIQVSDSVTSLTALASQDRFEVAGALESSAKALQTVSDQVSKLEERTHEFRKEVAREFAAAEHSQFAQIEALLELRHLLPTRFPMPPTRGWAAAPTTLLQLVSAVLERRPVEVVECGSGVSSLWIGYALEKIGAGHCVCLEHEPKYAAATRENLERHGLSSIVEVRDAPLCPMELSGETFSWFDMRSLAGLSDVGVLFVDGPPGDTGPLARFPAVPALSSILSDGGTIVVLDDSDRTDERALEERWCVEFGARVIGESPVEKGWTLLALTPR